MFKGRANTKINKKKSAIKNKKPSFLYDKKSDLDNLSLQALAFIEYLQIKNYTQTTIRTQSRNIGLFIDWANLHGINDHEEITRAMVDRYQKHLFYLRKKDNTALSFKTQSQRLSHLKSFFSYMCKRHILVYDPCSELELPRIPTTLPREFLSIDEIERVLQVPDIDTLLGIRDRAILETFYSTGIRRTELTKLLVHDLYLDKGVLLIREGKGQKDRYIPIGKRACLWVRKYLDEVRDTYVDFLDENILFLTHSGTQFSANVIGNLVKNILTQAGIKKVGSCHLFRHSFATLLLDSGADITSIQKMLGHSNLQTTEVYTHVSITKLQKVHELFHPAKIQRSDKKKNA